MIVVKNGSLGEHNAHTQFLGELKNTMPDGVVFRCQTRWKTQEDLDFCLSNKRTSAWTLFFLQRFLWQLQDVVQRPTLSQFLGKFAGCKVGVPKIYSTTFFQSSNGVKVFSGLLFILFPEYYAKPCSLEF